MICDFPRPEPRSPTFNASANHMAADALSPPSPATGPGSAVRVRVVAIREVAAGCKLVVLASADGLALPPGEPGSHIGLRLPGTVERQYSLLRARQVTDTYEIAIKRDLNGRGGSAYIHDQLQVGDVLPVEPPRNNFPLVEGGGPSVFVAGGIGITPILCMIRRLQETGAPWTLHYACRTRAEAAFRAELQGLPQVHFHFDDEQGGAPLAIAPILKAAPAGAHLYCCGPGPMLAAFEDAAARAGIGADFVHIEYFTQKYEAATEGGFTVELARSGRTVQVAPGQTILHSVLAAGVEVAWSCEEGFCGACETRVLAGAPDHRDAILSPREREASKTMFICCSGSKSGRLVLDL